MKKVVLGVCGSIAAYRAADLARDLMRAGCDVTVCLTDGAQQFVTPLLFETLTGNVCLTTAFEEPETGRIAHIDLARQADLVLIAPASANTLNKLAQGQANDMLTSLALAYSGPLLIAPAMNPSMYSNEATRASLDLLRARNALIIDPIEGDVVAGEVGLGKLAPNATIVEIALEIIFRSQRLSGQRVVITGGPTQEPIDSVRYISNRSSGKMAIALARAAVWMGADVHLILGPTSQIAPYGVKVSNVKTAAEMGAELLKATPSADWIVGAAAVADYRVANPEKGKVRRREEAWSLDLVPNDDLIAAASKAKGPSTRVVGFAAEHGGDLEPVRAKLVRKDLYAIAANDISRPDIGFESADNQLTLVFGRDEQRSEKMTKLGCAFWLWERLLDSVQKQ